MQRTDFDVVVIGGGAGGLSAASAANALGVRTCIIEKKRLGGDCTWFGCMPSKAMLKSASAAHLFKRFSEFGLKIQGDFKLDTSQVMLHVREVVNEISQHHPAEVFEKRGIKVIFGNPKFINEKEIEVNPVINLASGKKGNDISTGVNGNRILSKRFIICTGSHPVVPPIDGLKELNYLTNENIFDLKTLPGSLIVLGGGPIGVEFSQALNRLGVKIYLVEMMDRLLFREDGEASEVLERKLKTEEIDVLTGKKAVGFTKNNGMVCATLDDNKSHGEEISAENVLVAVGRAANVEGLSLEKAGVEYTKRGIQVNSYLQTTNKNIFACGDVVGPYMFSHMAAYQAQVCVRNVLFRRFIWQKASYQNVPWATFTEPELAHLGLTEDEARGKYKKIKVYKTDYKTSDRAVTDLEKDGLVKVITDNKGYILGAHIVGAQASEIIQGFLIAKSLRIPLAKLSGPIFIYPTLSELIKKTSAQPLLEKLANPRIKRIMKMFKTI